MARADRLIEVLDEAKALHPGAERDAFVQRACKDQPELMEQVLSLLQAHDAAGDFLASGPALSPEIEAELARLKPEEVGDSIGPYKLRERIGEGGFGTVWVAEQEQPVRRRVALKIIKMGMDTREVVARFEQERQALAMMDHPNIAKVLDAGATQRGRPYFIMELVRGVKITEYCDEQQLSMEERIELFIIVCQAVQHAHQKGIIHRDLKPSNILVTINEGEAVPKVIDFGVAKAIQGRLSDHTVYTQFQQMIGTPLYMSPEQAEMTSLDIDTRSDIYSLGVLLYELLTSCTPIDQDTMARLGLDEMRRIIRELDPLRPSLRVKALADAELTTAAKRRHTDPAKLPSVLRGDIDWIVMKCLEKDRRRRYDTAASLALDLRRHLQNDVVLARPPTASYLLGRLIRRNKPVFAAIVAIMASLLVGSAVSVWQAMRAVAALDELRESAPAFAEQARSFAAKEQFSEAIAKIKYAIKLRPDMAEYLVAKGDLLQCQLNLAEAAATYRAALRVKPDLARAEASAKLCDELLAAPPGPDGKLSRESLAKLHLAMQREQRPAAELMPVARLLGEEKKLLREYWLERLKDLPVSAERPLEKRLSVRDDGRLALDLSDTKVTDLSPLAGAPIGELNMVGSKQLTDLTPLRGLELIELNINQTDVADLSPLRDMRTLKKLEMIGTKVSDLSALSALQLTRLIFRDCPVKDLNPIRKMALETVNLRGTRVTDLSPLIGMPVKGIDLSMAPVLDFSPLAHLPLERCIFQANRITDLSVLRGKPLKELWLFSCPAARNYAVLSEIKTLELLMLPVTYRDLPEEDYAAIGALRGHPKLHQMSANDLIYSGLTDFGPIDAFWRDWDREQLFIPALRKGGFKFFLNKLPNGNYILNLARQQIRDLSILKGAPISDLDISECPIEDLSSLREMPLETLRMDAVPADIGSLRGMRLRDLYASQCRNVSDVAALAEMATLENLTIPPWARNIELLRKLPRLQRLGYSASNRIPVTTAAEFWKEYEASPWIARVRDAGGKLKRFLRLRDGTYELDLSGSGNFSDLAVLEGVPVSRLNVGQTEVFDLEPLKRMPLRKLNVFSTKVTDLTPLKGLQLDYLSLNGLTIASLEPLRGMPLKFLFLRQTNVTDLNPLRGMKLESLNLGHTRAADLEPLRGMPLKHLKLHDRPVPTDLSILAELRELTELTLPREAKDIDFLRAFPKLARIGFAEDPSAGLRPDRTAAEFWREYDAQKK
jgi:serine/threonine protein kinase/Leucine-rich repeat (LRR) protein